MEWNWKGCLTEDQERMAMKMQNIESFVCKAPLCLQDGGEEVSWVKQWMVGHYCLKNCESGEEVPISFAPAPRDQNKAESQSIKPALWSRDFPRHQETEMEIIDTPPSRLVGCETPPYPTLQSPVFNLRKLTLEWWIYFVQFLLSPAHSCL